MICASCSDQLKRVPSLQEHLFCWFFHCWGKFWGVLFICRRTFSSRNESYKLSALDRLILDLKFLVYMEGDCLPLTDFVLTLFLNFICMSRDCFWHTALTYLSWTVGQSSAPNSLNFDTWVFLWRWGQLSASDRLGLDNSFLLTWGLVVCPWGSFAFNTEVFFINMGTVVCPWQPWSLYFILTWGQLPATERDLVLTQLVVNMRPIVCPWQTQSSHSFLSTWGQFLYP